MISRKKFEKEIGGKMITLEVSSIAEQANAAVIGKCGNTVVLGTAVMSSEDTEGDYMPLKVDYEERFYAAGRILGSRYVRREGKASEGATLAARIIDRTIRPLFDQRLRRDTQVVLTVLSFDEENEPEQVALLTASAALAISDIPWNGPAAGVRVVKIGGKFVINPTLSEMNSGVEMEAFVSGPEGKINMIEMSGSDTQEADAMEALKIGLDAVNSLVAFQKEIVKEIGKAKANVTLSEPAPEIKAAVEEYMKDKAFDAVYPHLSKREDSHALDKVERERRLAALKAGLTTELTAKFPEITSLIIEHLFETYIDELVHVNILEKELRPDSRKLNEIRPLDGEVKLFERTHGSALFVRGNTQALAVTTIAPPGQEQVMETMTMNNIKRRFMLHYNFPPYSVGETGRLGSPGRREIGHGALAAKSIIPVIPTPDEFPYTIRVVSEILSSNGSSSMATVCATTMSLMDAGVPIKKPVAGIAMGLMSDSKGNYKVLTDLQGPEDHYGDMDFKVAGTKDGINAIQLDVKLDGLTLEMAEKTLAQAKEARLEILKVITGIIPEPRKEISSYAPKVVRFMISKEKIGALIGPGGKVINGLIEKYKLAGIDIEEDGAVSVGATDQRALDMALEEIKMITRDIKVGDVVEGTVVKILEFGAIVDLGGGMDGMAHVSELKDGYVKKVDDVLKLGDFVRAKVIRVEDGRIGLSLKQLVEK